jgi:hypothetical protein
MFNIEAIEVNRAHFTSYEKNSIGGVRYSLREVELLEPMRQFFLRHILKCLSVRNIRAAKSEAIGGKDVVQIRDRYLDACADKAMAENMTTVWFTDMVDEKQYIAILMMPNVQTLTIRNDGLYAPVTSLPNPDKALSRFAIVRNYESDEEYNVLFRNNPVYDNEATGVATAWYENFLKATEVPTPRFRTELVMKESEKFITYNADMMDDEAEEKLRAAVRAGIISEDCNVELIAEVGLNGDLREAYIGRLMDRGLGSTQFTPDWEWARKQLAKTTYVCDDGIKITGPSDAIGDVIQVFPKTADRKTRMVIETKKFSQK